MTPPPTQEDNRRGDDRYKTNQGTEDDRRAKGQCREQLKGKCNNAKKCEWVHKDPCIPYRDHGRAGCSNVKLCGKLHPYDCRSVEGGIVCDIKSCKLWHDKWEFKRPGVPKNPIGGWN